MSDLTLKEKVDLKIQLERVISAEGCNLYAEQIIPTIEGFYKNRLLLANEAPKKELPALGLHSIMRCLPDDKTIEALFNNGAHVPFYTDITKEEGYAGYHFFKGMKAMRDILKASISK